MRLKLTAKIKLILRLWRR